MNISEWLLLAGLIVALFFGAIASAAASVARHMARNRVQRLLDQGLPRAGATSAYALRLRSYDSAIAIFNALVIVVAGVIASALALGSLGSAGIARWLLAIAFLLCLVISQALPRLVALRSPERTARSLSGLVSSLAIVLSPLVALCQAIAALFKREPFGETSLAEDDLNSVVLSAEEGAVDEETKEMIRGIVTMGEIMAREIMTPRPDIIAVDDQAKVGDLVDVIVEQSYSRLPVYKENIDNILGVAYAKDLFTSLKEGDLDKPVVEVMRPAYFVPESKRAHELLNEMQVREIHMAIVVDEYGGTAGLVTIEDLLEEIVGEIRDEYDRGEENRIEETAEGEATFDGTVTVDDVNETLGLRLEPGQVDTIGGLVYDRLGKMPSPGDQVIVDGAVVTVLETDGRRIRRVKVKTENGHPQAREQD